MAQEMCTESIIIDCGSEKEKQKNNTQVLQQPSTCPRQSKSPVDVFWMKNKAQRQILIMLQSHLYYQLLFTEVFTQ